MQGVPASCCTLLACLRSGSNPADFQRLARPVRGMTCNQLVHCDCIGGHAKSADPVDPNKLPPPPRRRLLLLLLLPLGVNWVQPDQLDPPPLLLPLGQLDQLGSTGSTGTLLFNWVNWDDRFTGLLWRRAQLVCWIDPAPLINPPARELTRRRQRPQV